MTTYREKLGAIADEFWRARFAGENPSSKECFAAMDAVEPDPTPLPSMNRLAAWSACERPGANGGVLWSGSWRLDVLDWYDIPPVLAKLGLTEVTELEEVSTGYHAVWKIVADDRDGRPMAALLSYTEGDLYLECFASLDRIDGAVAATLDYYRRNR